MHSFCAALHVKARTAARIARILVLLSAAAACAPRVETAVPKPVPEVDTELASPYYWASLAADVSGRERSRLLREHVAPPRAELIPAASQQSLFDLCTADNQTPDVRIRACTEIIQQIRSPQDSADFGFRAIAYGDRGFAWYEKGEVQRARQDFRSAIQDFDQVILLDRTGRQRPYAYALRGVAKAVLGDKTGAEVDFATAKTLNPNITIPTLRD